MHEMSIATGLIEQVLRIAEANNAVRVDEIDLEVGFMRQVAPEAMEMAWEAVRIGTIAENAVLNLREIGISAECEKCGLVFQPGIDDFLCPKCRQANVRIVSGDDIILRSITCDTEEERPAK